MDKRSGSVHSRQESSSHLIGYGKRVSMRPGFDFGKETTIAHNDAITP